eukprot:g23406.t1
MNLRKHSTTHSPLHTTSVNTSAVFIRRFLIPSARFLGGFRVLHPERRLTSTDGWGFTVQTRPLCRNWEGVHINRRGRKATFHPQKLSSRCIEMGRQGGGLPLVLFFRWGGYKVLGPL